MSVLHAVLFHPPRASHRIACVRARQSALTCRVAPLWHWRVAQRSVASPSPACLDPAMVKAGVNMVCWTW